MPSIKDKSTVDAIARIFCGEGKRNKTETLKIVGYQPSYCNTRGIGVVYSNVRVIDAIKAIDDAGAAVAGVTVQSMSKQYDEDRAFAKKCNSASAAVSASIAKARLYGMDKDASDDKQQEELDKSKQVEAKRIAMYLNNTA